MCIFKWNGVVRMSIKPRKVGVLGAGNVGSHVALQIAVQGLADDIVFFDTRVRLKGKLWTFGTR